MKRWNLYREVRAELMASGFGNDQAADAARIADRILRDRRNECIRACRKAGWKIRQIARFWGVDAAMVYRLCKGVLTDGLENQRPFD